MDNHEDYSDFQKVPPPNLPAEPTPMGPTEQNQPFDASAPAEPFVPQPIKPINTIPTQTQPSAPNSTYNPAVPDFSMPNQNGPKKESNRRSPIFAVIVAIIAVLIIIGLAFVFYYYAIKSSIFSPGVSVDTTKTTPAPVETTKLEETPTSATPTVVPTNVVAFSVPEVLPTDQKSGSCWTSSIAYPYRQDAFRCAVGAAVYDPCFKTSDANLVFCQMNPIAEASFTIKLTKALPKITLPAVIKDNWAWFLKLKDGTICSPFTGTKIKVNGQDTFYGCTPPDKNTQILILGDLIKGDQVWMANKVTREKQGTNWVLKSTEEVEVDTVWQ